MLAERSAQAPSASQIITCPPRHQPRPADPCALVIFGASGDLTKRLVVPALYNLLRTDGWRDQLHEMLTSFVGSASAEFNTEHIDDQAWKRLAEKMVYVRGDLTIRICTKNYEACSARQKRPTAPVVTLSFTSQSPIDYSATSWPYDNLHEAVIRIIRLIVRRIAPMTP